VLFDLDNTLWHRDDAVRRLATAQHAAFPELASVSVAAYVERVMALDDRGRADKTVVFERAVAGFGLPSDLAPALRDHFSSAYPQYCDPAPHAVRVLGMVRAAAMKTGLITNGETAVQEAKIGRLGLGPLLDVVLISEREGVRKPDPEIFRRALTRLSVAAGEAWFVGDHPDADIRGAAEAGLTAVWLRSWAAAAPEAAYAIGALEELLPLLGLAAQAP
jgi:putative hydrolase of the HAD superfamily